MKTYRIEGHTSDDGIEWTREVEVKPHIWRKNGVWCVALGRELPGAEHVIRFQGRTIREAWNTRIQWLNKLQVGDCHPDLI